MTGIWGRLTTVTIFLVAVITLGVVRLGRPRGPWIPRIGLLHRWLLSVEARRRGRKDGKLGIPSADEKEAPPEIQKLKQQGDGVLRRIAARWSNGDARLKGEYRAICRDAHATRAQMKDLDEDLDALRAKCTEQRSELDAQRAADSMRSADERWRLGSFAYLVGIFFIFIGEFPLNAVAFRLFQEDQPATYTMTAGLAATLVLCAHALGVFLRMKPPTGRSELLSWLLGIFPILVIVAIGVIRTVYINEIGALTQTKGLASLGPVAGTAVFVIINLVIYLGACVLSYLHHDPEGQLLDTAERGVKRTERRIKKLRRRFDRHGRRLRWLELRQEIWKAAGEGAARKATYQALQHKDFYESFMQLYWSSNRLAAERLYRRRMRRWNRRRATAQRRSLPVPDEPVRWRTPKALAAVVEIRIPPEFDSSRPEHAPDWERNGHVQHAAVGEITSALATLGGAE